MAKLYDANVLTFDPYNIHLKKFLSEGWKVDAAGQDWVRIKRGNTASDI